MSDEFLVQFILWKVNCYLLNRFKKIFKNVIFSCDELCRSDQITVWNEKYSNVTCEMYNNCNPEHRVRNYLPPEP